MRYVRGWITKPSRTFIIGVGAQKAGTSWLYQYLRRVRHCQMPGHKEFHVWDVLDLPYAARFRTPEVPRHDHDALVASMVEDPDRYFDFFAGQLNAQRITGDITPSYAGLSSERLTMIDAQFASRGIVVKSIFLVRDPVSRCLSAFRMVNARREAKTGVALDDEGMNSAFLKYALSLDASVRTRYEVTWETNERVFGARRLHVDFFEQLFTRPALTSLDIFLDSHGWHRLREREYNALTYPSTWEPSMLARQEVAQAYRATYEYVVKRRPEVERLWGGYALLAG